jgi:hypothetical protein
VYIGMRCARGLRLIDLRDAIASTVLAHRESVDFVPFNDADYSNAYGPTVHFRHAQTDRQLGSSDIRDRDR